MRLKPFFPVLVVWLAACHSSQHRFDTRHLSRSQKLLDSLVKAYETDYQAAPESRKAEIKQNYFNLLQYNMINHPIDSLRVTVDAVEVKDSVITTRFHTGKIGFQYGLGFKEEYGVIPRALYQYMKNLRPGSEIVTDFSYTGGCQVNAPDGNPPFLFRIFAIPFPPDLQKTKPN